MTDLSKNVTRGMNRLAEQGLRPASKAAIGYVVREKRIEIGEPEDVALVRRMFEEYAAGGSLRGLAETLCQEGVVSPKHKPWTATGIRGVLTNRIYVGDFIWNAHCESKYRPNGRRRGKTDPAEWIVREGHHPALIDRALFDRVQAELVARKKHSTPLRGGGGFFLSGALYCGRCGYKLMGSFENQAHQYVCYGYRQRGKSFCDANRVKQDDAIAVILEAVERHYFNRETMGRIAAEAERQLKAKHGDAKASNHAAQLDAVQAKIDKATRRLVEVDADMLPLVQQQIRELQDRRQALLLQEPPQPQSRKSIQASIRDALAWFKAFKHAAGEGEPGLLRQFVRAAFERVDLWTELIPQGKRTLYRLDRGSVLLKPVSNPPLILTGYKIDFVARSAA